MSEKEKPIKWLEKHSEEAVKGIDRACKEIMEERESKGEKE